MALQTNVFMHLLNTKASAKDADKNENWQWVVIMVSGKKKKACF